MYSKREKGEAAIPVCKYLPKRCIPNLIISTLPVGPPLSVVQNAGPVFRSNEMFISSHRELESEHSDIFVYTDFHIPE